MQGADTGSLSLQSNTGSPEVDVEVEVEVESPPASPLELDDPAPVELLLAGAPVPAV
jgi:hypothetical protein